MNIRLSRLAFGLGVLVLASCTAAGGLTAPPPGIPSPAALTVSPFPGVTATVAALPASFAVSGRLVWVDYDQGVVEYDPASGKLTTVFAPKSGGLITAAAVSPDGKQMAMAYAAPVTQGVFYGNSGIYLLPADGSSAPVAVVEPQTPEELFVNPIWSRDGKALYYGHSTGSLANNNYDFWLERHDLATNEVTRVLEYAFFPQLSPDTSRFLYLKVDLKTYNYDLYMAGADGSNSQPVIARGVFFAIDAPIWSPDGKAVIFSAVGEPTTGVSPQKDWLAEWFGVGVAQAHSVPSDLWRMSLDGGKPERLTSLGEIGINPAFSPDGRYLAFLASAGLWIKDMQGGAPVLIATTHAFSPLQWVK